MASSQQAGGDTAWVRVLEGGPRAVAVSVSTPGRVAVAVGTEDGAATRLDALDATGTLVWSRPLAAPCPVRVQPLGVVATGALLVLASAPCAVAVAALGPAPIAPAGALVLLDAAGAPAGRIAVAADLESAVLVQAAVTTAGEAVVLAAAAASTVALVSPDGGERWRRELGGAWHVAAAPAGDVVVVAGSDPVVLRRLRRDGSEAWSAALPDGFAAVSVAVLTDGAVAALGTASVPVSWGRGRAGASDGPRLAVVVVEPDGSPRTAADVARDAAAPALDALPHGRVLVRGVERCDRLRALSPQLEPVWERALDPACAASAAAVALSDAGQIVLVGAAGAGADLGSGSAVGGSSTAAYALALWP